MSHTIKHQQKKVYHNHLDTIRTPTKENFNKTSEVESRTQTYLIYNNIYVKNDVFEAFYEDYLKYNVIWVC